MAHPTEKQLDQALEAKLRSSPAFATWFIGKTRFGGKPAICTWSRSDHPWGSAPIEVSSGDSGGVEVIEREGETDILAVFTVGGLDGIALHIENKLGLGKFTKHQPELYAARATKWVNNPKYGNYQEWETVLVAPKAFLERNSQDSKVFGCFIAHEDIAEHVDAFMTPEIRIELIEKHFHEVIAGRAKKFIENGAVELPRFTLTSALSSEKIYLQVPGMYGGFSYWFEGTDPELKLISESWIRVVEGSGQRHEITARGSRLVDEGFV